MVRSFPSWMALQRAGNPQMNTDRSQIFTDIFKPSVSIRFYLCSSTLRLHLWLLLLFIRGYPSTAGNPQMNTDRSQIFTDIFKPSVSIRFYLCASVCICGCFCSSFVDTLQRRGILQMNTDRSQIFIDIFKPSVSIRFYLCSSTLRLHLWLLFPSIRRRLILSIESAGWRSYNSNSAWAPPRRRKTTAGSRPASR